MTGCSLTGMLKSISGIMQKKVNSNNFFVKHSPLRLISYSPSDSE